MTRKATGLERAKHEYERGLIVAALEATGGHRQQAAQRLGESRGALSYKMKQHGLQGFPRTWRAQKELPLPRRMKFERLEPGEISPITGVRALPTNIRAIFVGGLAIDPSLARAVHSAPGEGATHTRNSLYDNDDDGTGPCE